MTQITLDIAGIEQVRRQLRLLPKEIAAASRRAAPRAGQRARATASKSFRQAGIGSSTIKRRVLGQRNRLWIGANPVTATLKLRGGVLAPGEFTLPVGGLPRLRQPVVRRDDSGRVRPVPYPILDIAREARSEAAQAALERFEEVFLAEGERAIIKAAERTRRG